MALTKAEEQELIDLELEALDLEEKMIRDQMTASEKKQPIKTEPIDTVTTAGRQFARFASGGFADELNQELEKVGQRFGYSGLGGPVENIKKLTAQPTESEIQSAGELARQQELAAYEKDFRANPVTAGAASVGGTLASPINKLGAGLGLAGQSAVQSAVTGFGESTADNLSDRAKQALISGGVGFGAGKVIGSIAPAVKSAGKYLGSQAEKLAVKATGATGKQSEKFAKGAGRELLDRGVVQAFDTPEKTAQRAGALIKQAENDIDASLKALDQAKGQVSQDSIVESLQNRIAQLAEDASQAPVVKRLQTIVDDIILTGKSNIPISSAEKTKRGFNKIARNWLDPEQGEAGKIAYLTYRDAVEEAAKNVNPGLLDKFKSAKKTFGLLNPIEEAASKRAAQLNASPYGGLLDFSAVLAGGGLGDTEGAATGLALAGLRRQLAPRLASTLAKSSDVIANKLINAAPSINQAAQFIPTSLLGQAKVFEYTPEAAREKYMKSKMEKTPTQKALEINEKRKLIKNK